MKRLVLVIIIAIACFADIPGTLNYQGKLTDPDGVAISGDRAVEFRIYNVETGGTALWSESHPAVAISHGLFDVPLGTITPLNLPFDEPYWVEIVVEGETMAPRQALNTVPYAFRAGTSDSAVSAGSVNWDSIDDMPAGFADGIDDVDDADSDPANELITAAGYAHGTHTLTITEAGADWDIDLSLLDDSGTDNQSLAYNSATRELDISGGSGVVLPVFGANPGMAPSSAGGTDDFLRADGVWAVPPGSDNNYVDGVSFNSTTGDLTLSRVGLSDITESLDGRYLTAADLSDYWSSSDFSAGDISNWNTAFGWGDHSTAGYLTSYTETDPIFSGHVASGITSTNISNWNTAFGWGDHSTAGYLTSEVDPTWSGTANTSSNIGRTGYVGIGTTTPGHKLHLYGTSNNAADVYSQTDAGRIIKHWFVNSGRSWSIGQLGTTVAPNYQFRITDETAGATRIAINTTGNVGIGTTSPSEILHVDNGASNAYIRLESDAYAFFQADGGTGNSGISFYNSGTGRALMWWAPSSNYLAFSSGDLLDPEIVLNTSGYLGIGTTSPTRTLDVNGTTRLRGHLYDYTNSAGTSGQVLTRGASGVEWQTPASGLGGSGSANKVAFWTGSSNLSYNTNFHWDNTNSRLGIGTSSPSYNLQVTGTGYFSNQIGIGITPGSYGLNSQPGSGIHGARFRGDGGTGPYVYLSYNDYAVYANGTRNYFSGNVGIGTTSPSTQLHTTSGVRFAGLSETTENTRVLTIDNSGNVSWRVMGNWATLSMIEDFETGTWPWSPWVVYTSGGSVGTGYAHEGSRGIINPDWHYRTDISMGNPGDMLSAWARPTISDDGRFYLGFGASGSGCFSLILAPNTNELIIQNNSGYSYTDVATVSQTYAANTWYRIEVEFITTTSVTCRLYASDGTTILNTVSYSGVTGCPGGIAIRGFNDVHIDQIEGFYTGSRRSPSVARSSGRSDVNSIIPQSEFGIAKLAEGEVSVNFTEGFANSLDGSRPGVLLTPIASSAYIYIEEVDDRGFVAVSDDGTDVEFTWMAMPIKAAMEEDIHPDSTPASTVPLDVNGVPIGTGGIE